VRDMLKARCEQVARLLIPAVRAVVAERLISSGMTQSVAARIMGVTQPAVNYYVKSKRGHRLSQMLKKDDEISRLIDQLADALKNGEASEKDVKKAICEICKLAVNRGYLAE